jgi:hypothetical protein
MIAVAARASIFALGCARFADELNGAGLGALLALFGDETQRGADGEPVERPVQYAVAVKVELTIISPPCG